jgi:hypothetical protein
MLNDEQVAQLKAGQAIFTASPLREGKGQVFVQLIPIRSAKSGRIVRYVVQSKNPTGEKGDVG